MDIISEATTGLKGISNSTDTLKEKKLREACAGFEALMLKQILSQARQGIEKSGLLDGGYGEEVFQSIQDDQMTQKMAASSGLGFGEMLYRQLSQAHAPQSPTSKEK